MVWGPRTWTGSWSVEWRSKAANQGTVWSSGIGVDVAGGSAPLMLWTGAGTGQGRSALLRAHPLLDDGVIRDGVFGRRLIYGTAEWRRWGSGFARSAARRAGRVRGYRSRLSSPAIRRSPRARRRRRGRQTRDSRSAASDVARGLRDGKMAVSFGWDGAGCGVQSAGCYGCWVQHRTQGPRARRDTEHRAPRTADPAPSTWHPGPRTQHSAPSTQHPALSTQHSALSAP